MEAHREQPPAYDSHNAEDLKLPSVPPQEPGSRNMQSDITLPDLRSVLATELPAKTVHPNKLFDEALQRKTLTNSYHPSSYDTSRTLPKLDASPRLNGGVRSSIEGTVISPSDTASVMSIDEPNKGQRSTSVVSIEDPDVRLAVEALSGLGNPDFVRSPPKSQQSITTQARPATASSQQEAEPLLTLLTDAHPWVGGTINGSLTAYTTTKHYSPRFVQYGADLIERNIGSPVANTVSSVGRRTGVESGIRKYLDRRRPSEIERTDSSDSNRENWSKRRRVMPDEMDVEQAVPESAISEGRISQEFLPAYRSSKPPSYREEMSPRGEGRTQMAERPSANRSWSAQVLISTSGLGVALSESSLRSLTYCVKLLTTATDHVETVMDALKMVLQEFDQAQASRRRDARSEKETEAGVIVQDRMQAEQEEAARRLAARIKQHCDDIWQTLKTVVNSVSTYAGGALPENARNLVKNQLMSIPSRWRCASVAAAEQDRKDGGESASTDEESEARKSAHRMIAFATEGLDMMAQVNGVVKITLDSAEKWLESLGRKARGGRDEQMMDADDARSSEDQERK